MKEKIKQIAATQMEVGKIVLFALCEDGNIFHRVIKSEIFDENEEWKMLPNTIPLPSDFERLSTKKE